MLIGEENRCVQISASCVDGAGSAAGFGEPAGTVSGTILTTIGFL
jgi:hypothetical protein